MKKLIYLLLLPLVVAVTACGGKVNSKKESVLAAQDSVDARGIQRMQTSKSEIDIKFKGKDYRSFVSRTPDESLPHVTNEMGDTYMDNKIVLRLTRGGESVFNKTFTKNDFFFGSGCRLPGKVRAQKESYMIKQLRKALYMQRVSAIRRRICMSRFP